MLLQELITFYIPSTNRIHHSKYPLLSIYDSKAYHNSQFFYFYNNKNFLRYKSILRRMIKTCISCILLKYSLNLNFVFYEYQTNCFSRKMECSNKTITLYKNNAINRNVNVIETQNRLREFIKSRRNYKTYARTRRRWSLR